MKPRHLITASILAAAICRVSPAPAATSPVTDSTGSRFDGNTTSMTLVSRATGLDDSTTDAQLLAAQTESQTAQAFLFANDPASAIATLAPFLAVHSDDPQANLLMAIALIKLDRQPDAKPLIDKGLAAHPGNKVFQLLAKQPAVPILDIEKQLIQTMSDPFECNWAWAQFYDGQNDHEKELIFLQECRKLNAKSIAVIDRIFVLAINQKDWPLADRCAADAATLDATSGKLLQGRLQFAQGNKDDALHTLRDAVQQHPDSSLAWTILGQAYADTQQTADAIAALQKALKYQPNNVTALKTLIAINLNEHTDTSIRYAEKYLAAARRITPNDPQLRVFNDLIGNPVQAIADREALRKIDPKNSENLRRLAVLYTKNNQVDKAIAVLEALLKQHPEDLSVADALARLHRDMGQTNEAIKLYEPFLTSADRATKFRAHILLGDMYRTMSNLPAAIKLYEDAARIDPSGASEAPRRLADLYFEAERMPDAERLYQSIYQAEPQKDPRVLRRWIETLIRQDKCADAQTLLDTQLLKDHPDDQEGSVLQGYLYIHQHKAQPALATFDHILDINPNNTDALHYRAYARFYFLHDRPGAIADLLRLRSNAPNAINSRLLLARVYLANQDFPESSHEYQEILALRPDQASTRKEYADMLFGLASMYVHTPAAAHDPAFIGLRTLKPVATLTDLLSDSIRRYPTQTAWPIMLGDLYGMTGDTAQAVQIHQAVFTASGKNLQIGLVYLKTLLNVRHYEEALSVADDLLLTNTSPELYTQRAMARAALGQLQPAADDFAHAADLAHDVPAITALARQCAATLGIRSATDLFRQRLIKSPNDFLARLALGIIASTVGNNTDAINAVTPLLTDPQAATAKPLALRILAMSYYQLHTFDKALTCYQQLLALLPNDLEVLNNIAYLLAEDLKRPQDAVKYAVQAQDIIESQPLDTAASAYSNVLDTVGWVKFLANDLPGATAALEKSIQSQPLPIAYYHLARIRQKQNDLPAARTAAEKSITLGTPLNDPILPAAQSLLQQLPPATP